jgi:hypothetical protein
MHFLYDFDRLRFRTASALGKGRSGQKLDEI